MSKLQDAQEILRALGLPEKQQTPLAGHVLLALGAVLPDSPWKDAKQHNIGVHAMIQFIGDHYNKRYAKNSRESIRKNVLRPSVQARVVDRNRDDPTRPTNSGLTNYCLTEHALEVIRVFGLAAFNKKATEFTREQGTLREVYLAAQTHNLVPVVVPGGKTITLSPGKHNDLEKAIIEAFGPRFAPGARLLYLGDTAKKDIVIDQVALERFGIPYSVHDKFPDVILHLEANGWLILIEAVTTHGPISPGRLAELKVLLVNCPLAPVFVTAFQDFNTFKSTQPTSPGRRKCGLRRCHLIHYNGNKFLGPTADERGRGE